MLILVVVGLARSGKDTVADYIARKHGFEKFVFSDLIADELRKKGQSVTKESMMVLGNELRKQEMGVLGKIMLGKIKGKQKVVLVGSRSPQELNYIRSSYRDIFVIKVQASEEKRFQRKSSIDPQDRTLFFQRDEVDIREKGLDQILERADFTISNNDSLAELYKKIDETMEEIKTKA